MLLSRQTLLHLASRGALTMAEHDALLRIDAPRSSWYLSVLTWVTTDLADGLRAGTLRAVSQVRFVHDSDGRAM